MSRFCVLCFLFASCCIPQAFADTDPLALWKPSFDPSGAKYTYLLSCAGDPAVDAVQVGYRIRDRIWKKSKGKIYLDFHPLNQLGNEKDVLDKLMQGKVQGMMCSSDAAVHISPLLSRIDFPFLLKNRTIKNNSKKLRTFRRDSKLWKPFCDAAERKGLFVASFTLYDQGVFIHLISVQWLRKLPPKLQMLFLNAIDTENSTQRKIFIKGPLMEGSK